MKLITFRQFNCSFKISGVRKNSDFLRQLYLSTVLHSESFLTDLKKIRNLYMMGKNQSVGEGHAKWLGEPGCGPQAACCTHLS